MKYLFFLISFIGLLSCANNQRRVNTDQPSDAKEDSSFKSKIVLEVDNSDPEEIGFEYYAGDESVGVSSILIDGIYAYLVDPVHRNVKRVNLITGAVSMSPQLGNNYLRLTDIYKHNDRFYVLSEGKNNYILSADLQIVDEFELKNGKKYFVGTENDNLQVYSFNSILNLNDQGIVVKQEENYIDILQQAHGKSFKILDSSNQSVIETPNGNVTLDSSFPYTWKDYYDSVNLDFDEEKLVFFESTPQELTLYIHPFVRK